MSLSVWIVASVHNPHKRTITKVPDDLWNEVVSVLPKEKPGNTVGRPIIPFRKVVDGIMFILRAGSQWKMLQPPEYGSSSTCHRRFQEWVQSGIFKRMWVRLSKECD